MQGSRELWGGWEFGGGGGGLHWDKGGQCLKEKGTVRWGFWLGVEGCLRAFPKAVKLHLEGHHFSGYYGQLGAGVTSPESS